MPETSSKQSWAEVKRAMLGDESVQGRFALIAKASVTLAWYAMQLQYRGEYIEIEKPSLRWNAVVAWNYLERVLDEENNAEWFSDIQRVFFQNHPAAPALSTKIRALIALGFPTRETAMEVQNTSGQLSAFVGEIEMEIKAAARRILDLLVVERA